MVLRVAICLSGQPRTWRKSLPFWQNMFADHDEVQYDVFFHFWNFNTVSASHNDTISAPALEMPILHEEQIEIVDRLGPISYEFSGPVDSPLLLKETMERRRHPWPHCLNNSDPLLYRHCQQFYSNMKVAHLKRCYEVNTGTDYDICVRARSDLAFPVDRGMNNLSAMPVPSRRTVYAIHTAFERQFGEFRLGDMFYYADSPTFDKMSLFFKGLSLMKESMFGQGVYPEIALMHYAKFLNLSVRPLVSISPKVRRDAVPNGRELAEYETL
jgi:hypothetical protein